MTDRTPSLYRFRFCGAAERRIRKVANVQSLAGWWLLLDGKRVHRFEDAPYLTPEQLDRAEVELAWDRLDDVPSRGRSLRLRYRSFVPYRASAAEIRAGWADVADQVERSFGGKSPRRRRSA